MIMIFVVWNCMISIFGVLRSTRVYCEIIFNASCLFLGILAIRKRNTNGLPKHLAVVGANTNRQELGKLLGFYL